MKVKTLLLSFIIFTQSVNATTYACKGGISIKSTLFRAEVVSVENQKDRWLLISDITLEKQGSSFLVWLHSSPSRTPYLYIHNCFKD